MSYAFSVEVHDKNFAAGEIPAISIITGTARITTATGLFAIYLLKLVVVLPLKTLTDIKATPLEDLKDLLKALAFNVKMIGLGLLEVMQVNSIIYPFIISPIIEIYKTTPTSHAFSQKIHDSNFFDKGRKVLIIAAFTGGCRIIAAVCLIAIYALKLVLFLPVKTGIYKAIGKEVLPLAEAKDILKASGFNLAMIGFGILEVLHCGTRD